MIDIVGTPPDSDADIAALLQALTCEITPGQLDELITEATSNTETRSH